MTEEEYIKSMMKYKKAELLDYLWKIREKTRKLRETFGSSVDIKTYREHDGVTQKGHEYLYFKFKEAIATYLGEKIK